MIVDGHIHLQNRDGRYSSAEADRCLWLADRARIDRMVYLFDLGASPSVDPTPKEIRRSNDIGLELIARHPDRFFAFCYLNPAHDPAFSLAELDRCLAGGCTGIKLWISVHADDPRLDPIMERAASERLPVLHHAWYKATEFAYNESTPAQIATLARKHPAVPIVMAHLGGGGQRGVIDIEDCPNVVVDTSGAQPHAGLIEFAVERLGPERVVFGSDWPIRDFAVQRAKVDGARIDEATRTAILGRTMKRLLSRRVAPEAAR
ncbi:MAG: amidohydrolase family protein [Thermomicrobiales bacterium]